MVVSVGDGEEIPGGEGNLDGFDMENLTRIQKVAVNSADNTIKDHLKESVFAGTLKDLQGNPIPNNKGGYWNHIQEMKDAYTSLIRAEKR